MRVDNLIAALYYCGVSNLATQLKLPESIEETESPPGSDTANFVDQSYADFKVLQSWINGTPDIQNKLTKSPVKHLYDNILAISDSVRSSREFYAQTNGPTVNKAA